MKDDPKYLEYLAQGYPPEVAAALIRISERPVDPIFELAEAEAEAEAAKLKGLSYSEIMGQHCVPALTSYVYACEENQRAYQALESEDFDHSTPDVRGGETRAAALLASMRFDALLSEADGALEDVDGDSDLEWDDREWDASRAYREEALTVFGVGSYAVILHEVESKDADAEEYIYWGDWVFVRNTAQVMLGFSRKDAVDLVTRIEHIGPQEILAGASLDGAVRLKSHLEAMGLRAEVKEGVPRLGRETGREPIPKAVQAEVWQRDGGQCVECGSLEGLEYDHIIPVSRGGANTVRNVQLLCETCSASKRENL